MRGRVIKNVVIGVFLFSGIAFLSADQALGQSYQAWYDNAQERMEYRITLKLAEIYHNAAGARIFDVHVDGQLFLDDFDTFKEAGGKNIAIDTTILS